MIASEKTTVLLVLVEALQAATTVGSPAPLVSRLWDWMHAAPRCGDLVAETTARRRTAPSRIGVVLKISRHRSPYERVTEILLLDPPCGKELCEDPRCIHRMRWSNAEFVRVPATTEQLAEALGRQRGAADVGRDDLIGALAAAGFEVRSPPAETAVRQFRRSQAVEAARWIDTDENRAELAAWFERHDAIFETRGPVVVLPEDRGEVQEGAWIVRSGDDWRAMSDEKFRDTCVEVTTGEACYLVNA